MKRSLGQLFILFIMAQLTVNAQDLTLARRLHDAYETFQEKTLTHRRFTHQELVPLINQLRNQPPFTVSIAGNSFEQRPIYQVKAGNGPIPILLWSQMHGDEATATMALFDIFNFLKAKGDGFDDLRQRLLTKTSLYFIPMLNPDGAERFQRRTALDIDMNRDALRLQSPESVILKNRQQTLKPLVGFNLHDQNPRYSVGKTGRQAVLSFLATAYDEDRNLNDVRKRSMQLIVGLNRTLQPFIPGQIARYDDEFEPRAFGDNIQKWGTTLILIESGGYKGDPEKMYIRKLNFMAILSALTAIAEKTYEQEDIAQYPIIPENGRPMFDVLIRNAQTMRDGRMATLDIGIIRQEGNTNNARDFYYRSTIDDLGDLSTFYGLHEIDATNLQLQPARVYAETVGSTDELAQLNLSALRKEGIVVFRVRQLPKDYVPTLPVHLLQDGQVPAQPLELGQIPTFLLTENGRIRYTIVNGFVLDAAAEKGYKINGAID